MDKESWVRPGGGESWMGRREPRAIRKAAEPSPLLEDVVEFVNTACPQCGTMDTRITATRTPVNGVIFRYHVCQGCKSKFKSCEERQDNHEGTKARREEKTKD